MFASRGVRDMLHQQDSAYEKGRAQDEEHDEEDADEDDGSKEVEDEACLLHGGQTWADPHAVNI